MEGGPAAPTEDLRLVGQNCDRCIFRPTVSGSIACVKTATAALLVRWEHQKYANACSHISREVKIKQIKAEKIGCFLVLTVTFINDATRCHYEDRNLFRWCENCETSR